jgi:hypothetical protein
MPLIVGLKKILLHSVSYRQVLLQVHIYCEEFKGLIHVSHMLLLNCVSHIIVSYIIISVSILRYPFCSNWHLLLDCDLDLLSQIKENLQKEKYEEKY